MGTVAAVAVLPECDFIDLLDLTSRKCFASQVRELRASWRVEFSGVRPVS